MSLSRPCRGRDKAAAETDSMEMADMTDLATQSLAAMTSPPIASEQPAIDVAHLSRMTLGDRKLEIQVLELFDRQADLLVARMREVEPSGVASLAHTLAGSARGIGAWRVAEAAKALESAVAANRKPALAQLTAAVDEARLAICGLLRIAAPT
jgi:HPt (histidine-containing phosphotransfer) domain-containing protein